MEETKEAVGTIPIRGITIREVGEVVRGVVDMVVVTKEVVVVVGVATKILATMANRAIVVAPPGTSSIATTELHHTI